MIPLSHQQGMASQSSEALFFGRFKDMNRLWHILPASAACIGTPASLFSEFGQLYHQYPVNSFYAL